MFKTLKNAWKIPELKSKLLFTLLIVIVYRIGSAIPVPYLAAGAVESMTSGLSTTMFDYFNTLSGGMFYQATLFALSVSPYITASIVMQLLTIAIPALEKLSKEGEEGRKKINQITRYVTVALSIITAVGYTLLLQNTGALGFAKGESWYIFKFIVVVACYCAGASIVMWIAERINEHGIGNGVSIILFVNIISSIPAIAKTLWEFVFTADGFNVWGLVFALACIIVALAVIALIVCVTNSERRIPIQYAKRVVGRKMYGGQGTNLPLKVNMTGVMPIIFASSIASLPATLAAFFPKVNFLTWISTHFGYNSWIYVLISVILIVAFSYFYTTISFNPVEVANNIKDNGGAVPGIRPGKPTSDYIKKILNRITAIGAVFLCFVSCFPMIVTIVMGYFPNLPFDITRVAQFAFGGTSLIIVIGVALETIRELEAQMTMRNYKGFLD